MHGTILAAALLEQNNPSPKVQYQSADGYFDRRRWDSRTLAAVYPTR